MIDEKWLVGGRAPFRAPFTQFDNPKIISELYAQVFEQNRALDKLEGFASFFGADFYGLPRNQSRITLSKTDWTMAEEYKFGSEVIVPICAGENLHWLVEDES
ncbi:MAG TPA: hypothetical protein EYO00_01690 [Gammaproteobacteria bacterium]|nr:hypothetical protein [Gammaproteobacteria bacterium]